MYKSEVRSDDSSVLREARTRGDSRVRQASRARNQRASLVDEQSGMSNLGQAQFPLMTRPMRAMRLLPKYSRLRLIPTDDHSDQTSEPDAHGGDQGDHRASPKKRASKVEPQGVDRISVLQIVDRDRDQRPA